MRTPQQGGSEGCDCGRGVKFCCESAGEEREWERLCDDVFGRVPVESTDVMCVGDLWGRGITDGVDVCELDKDGLEMSVSGWHKLTGVDFELLRSEATDAGDVACLILELGNGCLRGVCCRLAECVGG